MLVSSGALPLVGQRFGGRFDRPPGRYTDYEYNLLPPTQERLTLKKLPLWLDGRGGPIIAYVEQSVAIGLLMPAWPALPG